MSRELAINSRKITGHLNNEQTAMFVVQIALFRLLLYSFPFVYFRRFNYASRNESQPRSITHTYTEGRTSHVPKRRDREERPVMSYRPTECDKTDGIGSQSRIPFGRLTSVFFSRLK